MKLNGYSLVDRGNRPSPTDKVAIKVYFINNGEYYDPADIKDVIVFSRNTNTYPSSLLDADGLVTSAVSGLAKAYFAPSGGAAYLDPSLYSPTVNASGVYRVTTGEYVVVLDAATTGYSEDWTAAIPTTASTVGSYLDVWTVDRLGNGNYTTIINQFNLYDNTFISVTEPLLIKTNNQLITKKIPLGSKQDVKITTTFTIENGNLSDVIKNLINDAVIIDPMIKIEKLNDDHNLPSRVEVSGYTDTSGSIRLTADNTIVLSWDTDQLRTHAEMTAGNLGNMRGVYALTLKYDLLTERIVAPLMYIQLV